MGLTAELCEKIVATRWEDLNEEAIRRTRRIILDGIAVAVAGTIQEEAPEVLATHVKALGGHPDSTVINFGFKTSPVHAAYVNGASMHVLDFEPMWQPANHQVSTTLPAVLAISEMRGSNGREGLTAMIKGIEIMGWVREASRQSDIKTVRFHPPGLVGPLGSAVAASHLLNLDATKLRCAIGIVASRAGSILANVGTMSKSINCGHAVGEGVDAALLAERGFTANPDVIEHPRGYVASYFDERFKIDELLNYGPPFRVTEPGYAIKMFPSQFGTHFVITAGLELREKIGDPSRIRRVKLTTPMMAYIDRPYPEDGLDGKFSWQYTTACALLDGKVVMDSFTNERRFADDMTPMLDMIDVEMRDDITGNFDEMYVIAEATLDDGSTVTARCDGPRGKWGTPPIPEEDHLVKVRDCLALKYDTQTTERIIELGGRFDELSADDICKLMGLLAS